MPKPAALNTIARLLAALVLAALAGLASYRISLSGPREKPAALVATASASPLPTPSALPLPTPSPETAYRTSNGLRYADRDLYQAELGKAATMAQATDALSRFLGQYGVDVWTTSGTFANTTQASTTWTPLSLTDPTDLSDTKTFGSWLIDEWSKYPKEWVKISGIRTVALTKGLADNGNPDWGEAVPVGIVFYQVTPLGSLGLPGEDYLRRIIHHEFDHEIELQAHGGMQAPDSVWSALNPAGFSYGQIVPNIEHPRSAFVTGYSESAIGEDKAELYSFLLVDTDSKTLSAWEKSDPKLASKVTNYKAFLRSEAPIMDDAYFAAINP